MRIALHSVLREGAERDYEDAHSRIPDDLAASFARVGIHDWTIWRSGRNLFHLVECDDFAAAMAALDDDPANLRWQTRIGRFVDHFETFPPGGSLETPQVWRLSQQN